MFSFFDHYIQSSVHKFSSVQFSSVQSVEFEYNDQSSVHTFSSRADVANVSVEGVPRPVHGELQASCTVGRMVRPCANVLASVEPASFVMAAHLPHGVVEGDGCHGFDEERDPVGEVPAFIYSYLYMHIYIHIFSQKRYFVKLVWQIFYRGFLVPDFSTIIKKKVWRRAVFGW